MTVACSQTPTEPEFSDSDVILDRLHLVKNARVGMAYVDPEADFGQFGRVMLDPLDMSDTDIVQPARTGTTASNRPWELTDSDRQALQQAYREVFTRELQETGDYEVVTEPGPDVLRISAAITEIAPAASKDDSRSRGTGRSRVYTEGGGAMAIAFGFSDSESGEILAVVKDSRRGSPVWGVNNSVTNMSDVRFLFSRWARMLRARLDIAHGY
jgi:hypothetical protein